MQPQRTIVGKVISTKMADTAVVEVTRKLAHSRYHKRIQRITLYHAQTPLPLQVGDMVRIVETRPISATKHFKVLAKIS